MRKLTRSATATNLLMTNKDISTMNEMTDFSAASPVVPTVAPPPSVSIYGCGGCGINTARNAQPSINSLVDSVFYVDTSRANLRDGESAIIVGEGNGSGKVRAENAASIQSKITSLSDEDLDLSDINILLFSLSGGK